jgi:predicted transcriptional regulator
MEDNVITFQGPQNFSDFLSANPSLMKEVEQFSAIERTSRHINIGCKCREKARRKTANETYVNVLKNLLNNSIKDKIKEALDNPTKIIFKLHEDNEDKTVLVIE